MLHIHMPVKRCDGKMVYGSWRDGSDVLKDINGYYVMQWDPKTGWASWYKKYLPKTWNPSPEEDKETKTAKNRKAEASFCIVQ